MNIEPVYPDGAEAVSSYTPGMVAEGRFLFISGQIPPDLGADMETQIRAVLERIGKVLEAAGATFENIVMMRGYFVNLSRDLEIFRKVRTEFLKKPYPASTVVGVTALAVEGLQVEIEAVAKL